MRFIFSSTLNDLGPALFLISLNAFNILFTGTISLEKAFTSVLILNIFRRNFRELPDLMVAAVDIFVSSKRISYYLFSEEIDTSYLTLMDPLDRAVRGTEQEKVNGVIVSNGNFYWKDDDIKHFYAGEKAIAFKKGKSKAEKKLKKLKKEAEKKKKDDGKVDDQLEEKMKLQEELVQKNNEFVHHPVTLNLRDINFSLPRGTCTAVIGKVGSGKSSLLSALLGEMYYLPGSSVKIDKKIAYVAQQSWTLSKTIKENIIMGKPLDEERFRSALQFSCLDEDLKHMTYRENTMIGNKGVNLSGGQRARLSIARALYSEADVYLFDDPISALDINVGKTIMEKTILKQLRGKTILVATHALAYLPYFDNIFVIDNGSIIMQGNYTQLMANEEFLNIYKDLKKQADEDEERKAKEGEPVAVNEDFANDNYEVPNREEEALGPRKQKMEKSRTKSQADSFQSHHSQSDISIDKKIMTAEEKLVADAINIEDKAKGVISTKILAAYLSMIGRTKFIIIFILLCLWAYLNYLSNWFLQY